MQPLQPVPPPPPQSPSPPTQTAASLHFSTPHLSTPLQRFDHPPQRPRRFSAPPHSMPTTSQHQTPFQTPTTLPPPAFGIKNTQPNQITLSTATPIMTYHQTTSLHHTTLPNTSPKRHLSTTLSSAFTSSANKIPPSPDPPPGLPTDSTRWVTSSCTSEDEITASFLPQISELGGFARGSRCASNMEEAAGEAEDEEIPRAIGTDTTVSAPCPESCCSIVSLEHKFYATCQPIPATSTPRSHRLACDTEHLYRAHPLYAPAASFRLGFLSRVF
uniref:Uncharacterized protein n=1 Tax=Physcomitrium patens TaxID=3218 RepID=A0A2K1L4B2_PHYPA|nr:hypothetical protein PHYPA_003671 [Physcomitrium patens]